MYILSVVFNLTSNYCSWVLSCTLPPTTALLFIISITNALMQGVKNLSSGSRLVNWSYFEVFDKLTNKLGRLIALVLHFILKEKKLIRDASRMAPWISTEFWWRCPWKRPAKRGRSSPMKWYRLRNRLKM